MSHFLQYMGNCSTYVKLFKYRTFTTFFGQKYRTLPHFLEKNAALYRTFSFLGKCGTALFHKIYRTLPPPLADGEFHKINEFNSDY